MINLANKYLELRRAKEKSMNEARFKKIVKMYGPAVMSTNGLYHIYDKEHMERYINPNALSIDKRAKYKTVIVTDCIIVARVLTDEKLHFVILNKTDLNLLYRIDGFIAYIDENIICYTSGSELTVVSHTGKKLYTMEGILYIRKLYNKRYLFKSYEMFSDNIVLYDRALDEFRILTRDRNYSIYQKDKNIPIVSVDSMHGGKYTYDFEKQTCMNEFTGQIEKQTYLWEFY